MARWASLIEQRREKKPVLLVDAGCFCPARRSKNQDIKDHYFFEGMRLMKYDAAAVAGNEIKYSSGKLIRTAKDIGLPLVSSNIIDRRTGKLLVSPFIIKDLGSKRTLFGRKGGIRVGIFSVVLPDFVYSVDKLAPKYYEVKNPKIAALEAVSKLKKKGCHLIIALSHQGFDRSLNLAEEVPGIDIVINGHRSSIKTHKMFVENTLVVDTGTNRTSFTEIKVKFEKDLLIKTALDVGNVALKMKDHPEIIKLERLLEEETRQRTQ
jgi:5'-nucleotidase/UDP-sugar diphosphatase